MHLRNLIARKGRTKSYLPYAVGDGRPHVLHICRESGMTSLLPPDRAHLGLFSDFPILGLVENELRIATRRLDDIKEIDAMDILKIDIQGGELDVFKSGRRLLARSVAVQTEISFVPLYRGQPALGVIDTYLRSVGFIPHCFAELKVRPLSPLVIDGDSQKGIRQLLEADVVYVRDFSRTENMNGEQWKHLAMIAHHCYGSFDLAYRSVAAAARSGGIRSDAPGQYLNIVRSMGYSIRAAQAPMS